MISYRLACELVGSGGEIGVAACLVLFTADGMILTQHAHRRRQQALPLGTPLARWCLGANALPTIGVNLAHGPRKLGERYLI